MSISTHIGGGMASAGFAVLQGLQNRAAAIDAQRVDDWMAYWQDRALRAEAQLAQARRALRVKEDELLEMEALLEDA